MGNIKNLKGETMSGTKEKKQAAVRLLNSIAKETGSTSKTETIDIAINALHQAMGVPVKDAYEMILGEGSWDELVSESYNQLRQHAVATQKQLF